MVFLYSCTILVIVTISMLSVTNGLVLYKCCIMGYQFSANSTMCIDKYGENSTGFGIDDELDPQMNSSLPYWVPRSIHNVTAKVRYAEYLMKLPYEVKTITIANETSVNRFLRVDNVQHIHELRYFSSEINPSLVYEQTWCFEATNDPKQPIVIFSGLKLNLINKCCGKGQILNSRADTCIFKYGSSYKSIKKEILNPIEQPNLTNWFPKQLSRNLLKVKYNCFQPRYHWNVVAREAIDVTWEILNSSFVSDMPFIQYDIPKTRIKVKVKEPDRSAIAFQGISESFCFDEVEDGPLAPRVLMAGVTKVNKCCRIGEEIGSDLSKCVPITGKTVKEDNFGVLDIDKLPLDTKWFPATLMTKKVPVQYNFVSTLFDLFVNDILTISEDSYTMQYPEDDLPLVFMNISYSSGKTVLHNTSKYCFDTVYGDSKESRLILLDETCRKNCYTKCCLPNEIISPNGRCTKNNGDNWSPSKSSKIMGTDNETIAFPYLTLKTRCASDKFYTNNDVFYSTRLTRKREMFKTIFYCYDWQQTGDGVKEVIGSCEIPSNARTFETVRPLGLVSAAMLVVAMAMTLACQETRKSAHGRGLVCHTACLAVANSLQVAWFFGKRDGGMCVEYAYPVYFCLIGANFWLTAITFNMAHGFRQPLGAMARGGAGRDGSGGSKAAGRRFGIMSAFAWGGTFLLSLVTIAAHQLRYILQYRGIITPSLFETRTCYVEYLTPKYAAKNEEWTFALDLGSLCYYYGPLAVLVAANGVCVGLTIRTVRSLRHDTAILRRDAPVRNTGCAPPRVTDMLQSGLLYAKLLLTAGILELALEAATWAASPKYSEDIHLESTQSSTYNALSFGIAAVFLDLARSATVLWLCAGRRNSAKERLKTAWGSLKNLLVRRCGWMGRMRAGCAAIVGSVGEWCTRRRRNFSDSTVAKFSTCGRGSLQEHEKDSTKILT